MYYLSMLSALHTLTLSSLLIFKDGLCINSYILRRPLKILKETCLIWPARSSKMFSKCNFFCMFVYIIFYFLISLKVFFELVLFSVNQLRELESKHHEKLSEIAVTTLEKLMKNELDEEISEDIKFVKKYFFFFFFLNILLQECN